MPSHKKPPAILLDPNHQLRFKEFGSFALKEALTKHLAAAYPETPAAVLTALRDANLSRHNLARVAQHLESNGKILVMKVRDNGHDYVLDDGFSIGLDNYGICVAGSDLGNSQCERHNQCEGIMKQLAGLKENGFSIKRVPMKDMGKGFLASTPMYVNQSAGLMYIESQYDVQNFWEKYKKHMEPIVGPHDLEKQRVAARAFEAEMKFVIEAVPRYFSATLKDT